MTVEFHIGIIPNRPVSECVDIGLAAEKNGYDGVWVADSHSIMRDAYAILSVLAVKTKQIKIAAGVTHTMTRHPAVLANIWSTLHELSHGREIMGIGVGGSAVANLGLKQERLDVLEEKIRVIRELIRGNQVDYDGHSIQMAWSKVDVPVVMACTGPKSLQLAGRIADGVLFQVGSNPAFVDYALDNIKLGAQQTGRKLNDIKLYMRLACSVSKHRDEARENVKGYASAAASTVFESIPRKYFVDMEDVWQDLKRFKDEYDYAEHASNQARHKELLTDRIVDAIAVAGAPDEVRSKLQELAGKGLDGFVIPAGMEQAIPFMDLFAKNVKFQFDG